MEIVMFPATKKRTRPDEDGAVASKPFGYVNEENPFEDDDDLVFAPWWELTPEPGRQLTHQMTSDALWHSILTAAEGIRYKYIRHVPHMRDGQRQRQSAAALIMKLQLLDQLASTWHRMNLVDSNPAAFTWLRTNLDGMQESFQKRYGGIRVY